MGCTSASYLSLGRIRAAAEICRHRLRCAAASPRGVRLYPQARARLQRSGLRFCSPAGGFCALSCAAAARVRGAGAAASHRPFHSADADLSAGAGVGAAACLHSAATRQQRHLQQRAQHGRGQQRDQHGHGDEPDRADQGHSTAAADRRTRARRKAGRAPCCRGHWTLAAAIGGTQGCVANPISCASRRSANHVSARDQAGTATAGHAGPTTSGRARRKASHTFGCRRAKHHCTWWSIDSAARHEGRPAAGGKADLALGRSNAGHDPGTGKDIAATTAWEAAAILLS